MNDHTATLPSEPALDPFTQGLLEDANRFDQNAVEKSERVQSRLTIICMGLLVLTGISVASAVYMMMDKREVQPFVLEKDPETGAVSEVVRVESQQWSHGQATDMANVATYVRSREEYSDASSVFNYEQVELMSSTEEMKEYRDWFDPEINNLSPLALYPRGVVNIEITGVVRVGEGAVQAHFTRTVRRVPAPPPPTYWIAHVEFEYLTKNMELQARLRNYLGFTVRSYSVDEVLPSGSSAAPAGGEAAR